MPQIGRLTRLFCALLVSAMLIPVPAWAQPPKVDFYLAYYDGFHGAMRAESALRSSGFILSPGTNQGEERVGILGEYKGAICCYLASHAVVFVVAGPDYAEAQRLAKSLRATFQATGFR